MRTRCPYCYQITRQENEEISALTWLVEVLEAKDYYNSHGWEMNDFGCVEFELIELAARTAARE